MALALKKRSNRLLLHIKISLLEKLLKKNSLFILPILWCCLLHGVSGATAEKVSLSVKEGDSVTLQTDVNTNQHGRFRWYCYDTRIAEINRDPNKTCTDVQCKDGDEKFRGRLKLDHQTGSLTVMNIRTTDAGDYDQIISGNNSDNSKKTFSVSVQGVSAAEQDEVKEGENVTLYTGVTKNPNDVIMWYFNDTLIAGDQSKVCTDDQCDERFRDRLKLDNQTGSLTIMKITNTDSGRYQLQINSSRFSIVRNFTLTVPVASPPSTAAGKNAAVVGGVLFIAAAAALIYCGHKRCKKPSDTPDQGT